MLTRSFDQERRLATTLLAAMPCETSNNVSPSSVLKTTTLLNDSMTPMPGATSSTGVASTVTFRPMGAASVPSTMRAERSSIDVILQNYVFLVRVFTYFE